MRKALLLLVLSCLPMDEVTASDSAEVVHHDWDVTIAFDGSELRRGRLSAISIVTVRNTSAAPLERLTFLLYRLLHVDGVFKEGQPLQFSQSIVLDPDTPNLQLNRVEVVLGDALGPNERRDIEIRYAGTMQGYREVWPYLRERIHPDYTLLRHETLPYPVMSEPGREAMLSHFRRPGFTFQARFNVPEDLVAVAGGNAHGGKVAGSGNAFVFQSRRPVRQIDVAIAPFETWRDAERGLTVHVEPRHGSAMRALLTDVQRASEWYTRNFGPRQEEAFNIIQIPSGWGSYAVPGSIFIQADALEGDNGRYQLMHELAHGWNASAEGEVQRSRFFDEAFAVYFEALARREFEGEATFRDFMARLRQGFLRRAERDAQAGATPIAGYGPLELGGLSYTKGAWALHVLHELLGEEAFFSAMKRFLDSHRLVPATFATFQQSLQSASGRNLEEFFTDWITGSSSTLLLTSSANVEEIANRYR